MADHMTAEQLRELIESAQALADSLPRGDTLRYYCKKNELTRLRKALDAARLSGMAAAQWQPIETAPKRARILVVYLLNGKWRRVVATYFDAADMIDWENGDECEPGWYERSDAHEAETETIYAVEGEPKYWQHLPASPEPPHG